MTTETAPNPSFMATEFARLENLIKPLHRLLDLLERPEDDEEGLGQRLVSLLTRQQEALDLLQVSAATLEKQTKTIVDTQDKLTKSQLMTQARMNMIWQLLDGPPAEPSEG